MRLSTRLGGSELWDQYRRLLWEALLAWSQLHGSDSRLHLRLSPRIHRQTMPREDRLVLGKSLSQWNMRGQFVQPRVHLSSGMDWRGLRNEHQRVCKQTLQKQRPMHRSSGRIHVYLRARLHRQTVSTHHRRLRIRSLSKWRDLHRPTRGIRLQVQARFRWPSMRSGTGRVSERSLQPCRYWSLRRFGQHVRVPLSRGLHRVFVRDQHRRLRLRPVSKRRHVQRRGWWIQMYVSRWLDRSPLRDRRWNVPESSLSERCSLRGPIHGLFLRVRDVIPFGKWIVCDQLWWFVIVSRIGVHQGRMENSAKPHPNVALEILACTTDVAKILDRGSTVLVPMIIPELDVSTSMMLARLALARTVQLVSTKDLDSLVFVLRGIQVIGLTILQRFF